MELVITVVLLALGYSLLKRWLDHKEKARADRVRLLEEALRNPGLDRQTVEGLAQQLNGPRGEGLGFVSGLALLAGWLGLFTGAGLVVAGALTNTQTGDDMTTAGWITTLIAFGLLSYPFAVRELESRGRR
jgi:hypothetical protein